MVNPIVEWGWHGKQAMPCSSALDVTIDWAALVLDSCSIRSLLPPFSSMSSTSSSSSSSTSSSSTVNALVHFTSSYTHQLIISELEKINKPTVRVIQIETNTDEDADADGKENETSSGSDDDSSKSSRVLSSSSVSLPSPFTWSNIDVQWTEFELHHWPTVLSASCLASSYCVRKGLIRKSQFAYLLNKYKSKRPASILHSSLPRTFLFQLDDPDEFDEVLCDLPEIKYMNQRHEYERAMGLRGGESDDSAEEDSERDLFSDSDEEGESQERKEEKRRKKMEETKAKRAARRAATAAKDAEEEAEKAAGKRRSPEVWILKPSLTNQGNGIELIRSVEELEEAVTQSGDVREWILQEYIANPLLLPHCFNRKFHCRVYVLAVGNLSVYVFDEVLALFAVEEYDNIDELWDMDRPMTFSRHITNTCVNHDHPSFRESEAVRLLSDVLKPDEYATVMKSIREITGEVFAALHSEPTFFLPFPNSFELYGFDFLIDSSMKVSILEANAGPDFAQTGNQLQSIIQQLIQETIQIAVQPYIQHKIQRQNATDENQSDTRSKSSQINAAITADQFLSNETEPQRAKRKLKLCYQKLISETLIPKMNFY